MTDDYREKEATAKYCFSQMQAIIDEFAPMFEKLNDNIRLFESLLLEQEKLIDGDQERRHDFKSQITAYMNWCRHLPRNPEDKPWNVFDRVDVKHRPWKLGGDTEAQKWPKDQS